MKPNMRYWADVIIKKFEDLLNKYNIKLPCNDREGREDEAAIYGADYYELEDVITDILEQQQKTKNVRYSINNNSSFNLCDNFSFEDIKKKSIETKEVDNQINLAVIENERYNISALLHLYKGKLYIGYNIHSNKNYNVLQGNVEKEEINISNINTLKEMKEMMEENLAYFFIMNREYIEKISKNLGEIELIEYENQDEEEL